ncbi:MAG: glycosyltransferase [Pirellulales bacterium]|nr:glycosyltransferase [Pirellulales bacterium]
MARFQPPEDRDPLRVLFVHTFMPVGGAETLLVNLIRRLDRARFSPEVCCLKFPGPLGEVIAKEVPLHTGLLANKYDLRVLQRLVKLIRARRIDAVVTVGAGDRMFWGRLAARIARVPVVLTALHSTGWPDVIGRLNRSLTKITDGFIAVAEEHARYLRDVEGFPAEKVFIAPNGVNVQRFAPRPRNAALREVLKIPVDAPTVGIVAALRPEKDHHQFLRVAQSILKERSDAHFLIVGDGDLRPALKTCAKDLGVADSVHFLGTRDDVPELLCEMDVVTLTSKMEANPVTILEALAAGRPFVAPNVGSIAETLLDGRNGYIAPPGDEATMSNHIVQLLNAPELANRLGAAGRERVVKHFSLERMVESYEDLIESIYREKCMPFGDDQAKSAKIHLSK